MNKPRNVLLIIKALLMGMVISLGGKRYRMDIDYRLCQIANNQHGDEVLMVVSMGDGIALSNFIGWCEAATDDEIIAVGANIALNELNGNKL